MPRKYLRRIMPSVDKVREIKAFGMFGDTLFHPALWHLNRRSAAGGVAVGLFCGLIPGPLQMLGAAIGALLFRVNLPLALAATLYTNPLTIVPLYLVAYEIGSFVLGASGSLHVPPGPDWDFGRPLQSIEALGAWAMSLGAPLALGVFLLACLISASGYLMVRLAWSVYLRRTWQARKQSRPRPGA
jgi:hypothetical protein